MKSTRPVAVITGAARGIGKGCALELARGGFNLLINDRPDADSVEKLHATQQECLAEGVEVICFPADVGDLLHEEMLDAAQNQWGRLDCLLNNAGISVKKRGDLLDLEPDSFDQNIAINTRAPFFLAQAFSKRLLAQPKPEAELPHRSIIFVSSINAIMLAMNRGEYTIAKTAVSAAARLFAARLCNEQIGVYGSASWSHQNRYDYSGNGLLRRTDCQRSGAVGTLGLSGGYCFHCPRDGGR